MKTIIIRTGNAEVCINAKKYRITAGGNISMERDIDTPDIVVVKFLDTPLVSNRFEFIFHPVTDSHKLKDKTRALVRDVDGCMQFAVWYKNGGWYDEGSICYAGGISGEIPNVVEFALNGC